MKLTIRGGTLEFWSGGRLAGIYRADDGCKPHLARLLTPNGHALVVCRPHDHPHHKGVQFGLRTKELNFWEEQATAANPLPVGVQAPKALRVTSEWGSRVGFEQELLWASVDGSGQAFRETRALACEDVDRGFCWTWRVELEPLRDVELTQSVWAMGLPDGRRVNYDGLGFRLRRDFSGTGGNTLVVDGRPTAFAEASGAEPREVVFTGSIDETWPVPKVSLTVAQTRPAGLFVIENPFAFVSVGPSNLGPVRLARGQVWSETYTFTAADA